jgi:hypothetical protein
VAKLAIPSPSPQEKVLFATLAPKQTSMPWAVAGCALVVALLLAVSGLAALAAYFWPATHPHPATAENSTTPGKTPAPITDKGGEGKGPQQKVPPAGDTGQTVKKPRRVDTLKGNPAPQKTDGDQPDNHKQTETGDVKDQGVPAPILPSVRRERKLDVAKEEANVPPTPKAGPYDAVDQHALSAPPEAEKSLAALAKYLQEPLKTDKEKARAAFRWVTDRIAYDAEAYLAMKLPDQAPTSVLANRKAVCAGFAKLFADLTNRMGVRAEVVDGYVRLQYYPPDAKNLHSWAIVQIDGQWWPVEPTFGAGGLVGGRFQKRYVEFCFLVPLETFAFTHFPFNPKKQLPKEPRTLDEFMKQPQVTLELLANGVSGEALRAASKTEGFREFVPSYCPPGMSVRIVSVPLTKHLQAGQEYEFHLTSPDVTEMVIFNEGVRQYFSRDGEHFTIKCRVEKGGLRVSGKKSDSPAWSGFLQYAVE